MRTMLLISCGVLILAFSVPVEGVPCDSSTEPKTAAAPKDAKSTKSTGLSNETPEVKNAALATKDSETTPSEGPEESKSSSAEPTPPASSAPGWKISVAPYFFLAGLDGTVGVGPVRTEVNAAFRDLFRNLDFAIMGQFEARKGNWSILGDVMYVSLSGEKVTPNPLFPDVELQVKETIIEPAVAYRVLKVERGAIDLIGGVRFWHVKPHITFQPRIQQLVDVEDSKNWADPIVGAKGTASLSPRVFILGRFDVGGFGAGSDFTGRVFGGVGFQVTPRVGLVGGYRYLRVDYANEGFIFRTAMSGFVLGAKFDL